MPKIVLENYIRLSNHEFRDFLWRVEEIIKEQYKKYKDFYGIPLKVEIEITYENIHKLLLTKYEGLGGLEHHEYDRIKKYFMLGEILASIKTILEKYSSKNEEVDSIIREKLKLELLSNKAYQGIYDNEDFKKSLNKYFSTLIYELKEKQYDAEQLLRDRHDLERLRKEVHKEKMDENHLYRLAIKKLEKAKIAIKEILRTKTINHYTEDRIFNEINRLKD